MIKLNNKGFAFSTILYGLMIMGIMIILLTLSSMQTNRAANKNFVDGIEEELNRYSLTETEFSADIQSSQEYIVPVGQAGWYKIELWGAQGAGNGGLGAYTSGLIWLSENAHLYFYIGSQGSEFNGGGKATGVGSNNGGGASDVRLVSGDWSGSTSLASRLMVAAGGGGTGGTSVGGSGGTIIGGNSSSTTFLGATQEGGTAIFGKGGSTTTANSGGGGGGYYGGLAGSSSGGGGGSSYISGYAGVYTQGNIGSNATWLMNYSSAVTPAYFLNGLMVPGVKSGDGAGKISKVSSNDKSNPPDALNSTIYSGFRYVRDCVKGTRQGSSDTITNNTWKEIQVIQYGKNIAYGYDGYGKNVRINNTGTNYDKLIDGKISNNTDDLVSGTTATQCMVLDLGSKVTNISEIAVWHDFSSSDVNNVIEHRISVSDDNTNWVEIVNNEVNSLESYETANGFHYSSWQPSAASGSKLANGSYYILAATDNRFSITRRTGSVDYAALRPFQADNTQLWSITDVGANFYRIDSIVDGKALQLFSGTNIVNSPSFDFVSISDYVGGFDWEKFKITSASNGTFYITTPFNTNLGVSDVENLSDQYIRNQNIVTSTATGTAGAINRGQRYKFLFADY